MLDELAHFLLITKHGTFTEAARHAHLSQPALSASIRRLEEQLGGRLLERGPRGARLTASGRALAPWAEAALGAVEQGRRAVAAVEGLEAGEVRLGAGATACTTLLPPLLTEFHATHPGIRLYLREATSAVIRQAVHAGTLDFGVVSDPEGAEPWRTDTLVLVIAPGVGAEGAPHLTFPPGANHRELLDRHFPDVEIAMELNSIVAIKAHVAAGMGVALLSRSAVQRELDDGQLVVVADERTPLTRTLYLLHPGAERLSLAASALRAALMAATEPRSAWPPPS